MCAGSSERLTTASRMSLVLPHRNLNSRWLARSPAFVSFVRLVLAGWAGFFEAEQLEPRRRVAIKIVRDDR